MSQQWVAPVVLENEWVRLEPLAAESATELFSVCANDTFRYYVAVQPREWTPSGFEEYILQRLALSNVVSFVVRDLANGQLVGETSFMEIRPEAKGLEIGMTWYAESARGTRINPASKLLLLSHAFDQLGAIRVQLKCDARNAASRAAILKLGARFEGILRRHGILPDGYVRDTAMYSIIDTEWPEVQKGLNDRLANPLKHESG